MAKKVYDISETGTDAEKEAFTFYASHLVALAMLAQPIKPNGSPNGEATCYFYPGFVMVIRRRWYLATAGHILADIEKKISKRQAVVQDCRLLDWFGSGAESKLPIPFDFPAAYKLIRFDKSNGLDFALLEINANQQQLLKANGVRPISKKDWKSQDHLHFVEHFMLGLPTDSIERSNTYSREGYVVHGRPVPNMIYIKKSKTPE